MKKTKVCLFIVLLLIKTTFAKVPTPESLWQNLSNPNISGNFVTMSTIIEGDGITSPRYVQFIFSREKNDIVNLLQTDYSAAQMHNSQIIRNKIIYNLHATLLKESSSERAFFYGILLSLVLNDPIAIGALIAKQSSDYQSNDQLLNTEKIKLMQNYLSYLRTIKDDRTKRKSLTSPLDPADLSEQKRINSILKGNTLPSISNVSLTKDGPSFFWKMHFNNFFALFTNEDYKFYKMVLSYNDQNLTTTASNYFMSNGTHSLPKNIQVKTLENKAYNLTTLSFTEYQNHKQKIGDILLSRKIIKEDELTIPSFLY